MSFHLLDLLEKAATEAPENGLTFYGKPGSEVPVKITYKELLDKVESNASLLLSKNIAEKGRPLLVHLDSHYDYIEWYWSIIATGAIPAISTPLASDPIAADRHLKHLENVLQSPKILTVERLRKELDPVQGLDIITLESLEEQANEVAASVSIKIAEEVSYFTGAGELTPPLQEADKSKDSVREWKGPLQPHPQTNGIGLGPLTPGLTPGTTPRINGQAPSWQTIKAKFEETASINAERSYTKHSDVPAALMLTSGSSGNSKAVVEEHAQMLAAVQGKTLSTGVTRDDIFLNWIGFDHVACLTEIHLLAVLHAANQIHITPVSVTRDPLRFFTLIEEEKVTHAFAPNFFVNSLVKAYRNAATPPQISLKTLKNIVSGGEANLVATAVEFTKLVKELGGPDSIVRTAFGMTETCGGCHYNFNCPEYETSRNLPFCAVGLPTPSILQRITSDDGTVLPAGENGNLELSGPAVFKKYYNNPTATADSFSADGWFKTGDKGAIDSNGNLVLGGRSKDSLIINGMKYFSHELEAALEEANIPGITASYTAVFSTFPPGGSSEEVVVVFLPTKEIEEDDAAFVAAMRKVSQISMLYCSKKPLETIPLTLELLPKSALGKLSRQKLKAAYEKGVFKTYQDLTKSRISSYTKARRVAPSTEVEKKIVKAFAVEFQLAEEEVGVEDSLVDMGIDSIALVGFKKLVENALGVDIPMISILRYPSIAGLASQVEELGKTKEYDPVVELNGQQEGADAEKRPIWFIHPGLGEILVFLNLTKYFSDRAVYAIRAPGFNPGEEMFGSLEEMLDIYLQGILKTQPEGPYVICGYSFGGMVAFEIAKRLRALGHEIAFLASIDCPPSLERLKVRMDWPEAMMMLLLFLAFIPEETVVAETGTVARLFATGGQDAVLDWVMQRASVARLRELDLNREKLRHWATLTMDLGQLTLDYKPSDSAKLQSIDCFYADPPLSMRMKGVTKQQWMDDYLIEWDGYVEADTGEGNTAAFHECAGNHHTMLDGDNVFGFQRKLKDALAARGVI